MTTYYALTITSTGDVATTVGDVHEVSAAVKQVAPPATVSRIDETVPVTRDGSTGKELVMWYANRTATESNLPAFLTSMAVSPNGNGHAMNGTVVMVTRCKELFDIAVHTNTHVSIVC